MKRHEKISLRGLCADRTISFPGKELLSDKDAVSLRRSGRDVLLWLRYAGERMALYLNEEKINDHFYTGQNVPVSLGYFHFPRVMRLEVEPLEKDAPIYLEKHPDYVNGAACELVSVWVEDVYRKNLIKHGVKTMIME